MEKLDTIYLQELTGKIRCLRFQCQKEFDKNGPDGFETGLIMKKTVIASGHNVEKVA